MSHVIALDCDTVRIVINYGGSRLLVRVIIAVIIITVIVVSVSAGRSWPTWSTRRSCVFFFSVFLQNEFNHNIYLFFLQIVTNVHGGFFFPRVYQEKMDCLGLGGTRE